VEGGPVRVGSIVIDCDDFPKMRAFWQSALGYVPRESGDAGWVVLKDPKGRGPNLSLNRTSEGHLEPYRLHLDLYTPDQEGEVRRLCGLGATLEPMPEGPDGDFVMLRDPDGNLFCVVQKEG
jgi:catechol 2,3-dioxygenase-like lactoylglutathione lyase family enzyme